MAFKDQFEDYTESNCPNATLCKLLYVCLENACDR